MSRDIRFRAWVAGVKQMMYSDRLIAAVPLGMFWNYVSQLDSPELMQFTGLKDKNGKEIYEGDYLIDDDSEPTRHRIVWDEWAAKYELETWEGDDRWDKNLFDWEPESQGGVPVLVNFEVIGNIYENPELLTSSSDSKTESPSSLGASL